MLLRSTISFKITFGYCIPVLSVLILNFGILHRRSLILRTWWTQLTRPEELLVRFETYEAQNINYLNM